MDVDEHGHTYLYCQPCWRLDNRGEGFDGTVKTGWTINYNSSDMEEEEEEEDEVKGTDEVNHLKFSDSKFPETLPKDFVEKFESEKQSMVRSQEHEGVDTNEDEFPLVSDSNGTVPGFFVVHTVKLGGVSADVFNTNQKFIQPFRSTVANILKVPTSAIFDIVATDPAEARVGVMGCAVKYKGKC